MYYICFVGLKIEKAHIVGLSMGAFATLHLGINAQGRVSARVDGEEDNEQRKYLMDEGVVFDKLGRVDFRIFGWEGPDMDWLERNGCFPAVSPRTRGK